MTERRRTHEKMPEFATARWDCRVCGWSSDGEAGDPDQRREPDDGPAGPPTG